MIGLIIELSWIEVWLTSFSRISFKVVDQIIVNKSVFHEWLFNLIITYHDSATKVIIKVQPFKLLSNLNNSIWINSIINEVHNCFVQFFKSTFLIKNSSFSSLNANSSTLTRKLGRNIKLRYETKVRAGRYVGRLTKVIIHVRLVSDRELRCSTR